MLKHTCIENIYLTAKKIPSSCLNENEDSQICADGGRAFYSAMVCGKNGNWWALV